MACAQMQREVRECDTGGEKAGQIMKNLACHKQGLGHCFESKGETNEVL